MLPFGDATSPSATTVPAGTGVIVGLGSGVLAGSAVAGRESAGLGVADGVGRFVGAAECECVCATRALAFPGSAKHPDSVTAMVAAMPIPATARHAVLAAFARGRAPILPRDPGILIRIAALPRRDLSGLPLSSESSGPCRAVPGAARCPRPHAGLRSPARSRRTMRSGPCEPEGPPS